MNEEPSHATPLSLADVEFLYRRYWHAVLHRCNLLLADENLAWDAMQITFTRAIRYRSSFRGESEPLTWLFSIAIRVCHDQRKKTVQLQSMEDVEGQMLEADPNSTSFEEALSQQRLVAKLLPRFSEKIQQVVVMRYFDDMEVHEISRATSTSTRTVLRRLGHFHKRSRRFLE